MTSQNQPSNPLLAHLVVVATAEANPSRPHQTHHSATTAVRDIFGFQRWLQTPSCTAALLQWCNDNEHELTLCGLRSHRRNSFYAAHHARLSQSTTGADGNGSRKGSTASVINSPLDSVGPKKTYLTAEQEAESRLLKSHERGLIVTTVVLLVALCLNFVLLTLRFGFAHSDNNHIDCLTTVLIEAFLDVVCAVSLLYRGCAVQTLMDPTKSKLELVWAYLNDDGGGLLDIAALFPLQYLSPSYGRLNRLMLVRHFQSSLLITIRSVSNSIGSAETVFMFIVDIFFLWFLTIGVVMNVVTGDWAGASTWLGRDGWDSYESPFHVFVHSANL
eukprot:PhM_4_TR10017/c0_g1_i2/m.34859